VSDDPAALVQTAGGMAAFLQGKNAITSPWWAVGAAVDAIAQLAAEEGPLEEPARVALQVMATVYNNKMTGGE
jgi:hypothetical protein